MKKSLSAALVIMSSISGCATPYNTFQKDIRVGSTEQELEARLKNSGTKFSYYTCQQAKELTYSPKIKCVKHDSAGLYSGIVNDGAYLLGMGYSDVLFQIEIGIDSKVHDIRTEKVYTFL